MNDQFWADQLDPGERLLWTGRPKPRLSIRNFQLIGPFIGAAGTVVAGGLLLTYNDLPVSQSVILAVIIALVVLSLVRGLNIWSGLNRTRYALTTHRALFFKLEKDGTRVKAFPRSTETKPDVKPTNPPSVFFIRQESIDKAALVAHLGFEYIEDSNSLSALMATSYEGADK
ncbi:MAG TPA: hypothetical protein ENH56_15050 [Roseobacter sp.]|uniref:Uncharacterized protein n=1 Tax=marine sediment metagenome TaxID=412755 RepID=A0A0F9SSG9_9ZZZZ|nr:hypothetical protein [Roseobacter sp.]